MDKWLLAVASSISLASCVTLDSSPQPGNRLTAVAEVRDVEERFTNAFNAQDTQSVEAMIAPEYTLASTGPQGTSVTRRDVWLENWKDGAKLPFEARVVDVVVAGDTAVAILEASWRRNSTLTDTWVRRDGRWQLVFRHSAPRP